MRKCVCVQSFVVVCACSEDCSIVRSGEDFGLQDGSELHVTVPDDALQDVGFQEPDDVDEPIALPPPPMEDPEAFSATIEDANPREFAIDEANSGPFESPITTVEVKIEESLDEKRTEEDDGNLPLATLSEQQVSTLLVHLNCDAFVENFKGTDGAALSHADLEWDTLVESRIKRTFLRKRIYLYRLHGVPPALLDEDAAVRDESKTRTEMPPKTSYLGLTTSGRLLPTKTREDKRDDGNRSNSDFNILGEDDSYSWKGISQQRRAEATELQQTADSTINSTINLNLTDRDKLLMTSNLVHGDQGIGFVEEMAHLNGRLREQEKELLQLQTLRQTGAIAILRLQRQYKGEVAAAVSEHRALESMCQQTSALSLVASRLVGDLSTEEDRKFRDLLLKQCPEVEKGFLKSGRCGAVSSAVDGTVEAQPTEIPQQELLSPVVVVDESIYMLVASDDDGHKQLLKLLEASGHEPQVLRAACATLDKRSVIDVNVLAVVSEASAEQQAQTLVVEVTKELEQPEPDYEAPKFKQSVEILKSARSYVRPLCGGTWEEWHAVGECQVCAAPVDRKEKGLHCSNGGHRICWPCMANHIDFDRVLEEDPNIFKPKTTDQIGVESHAPSPQLRMSVMVHPDKQYEQSLYREHQLVIMTNNVDGRLVVNQPIVLEPADAIRPARYYEFFDATTNHPLAGVEALLETRVQKRRLPSDERGLRVEFPSRGIGSGEVSMVAKLKGYEDSVPLRYVVTGAERSANYYNKAAEVHRIGLFPKYSVASIRTVQAVLSVPNPRALLILKCRSNDGKVKMEAPIDQLTASAFIELQCRPEVQYVFYVVNESGHDDIIESQATLSVCFGDRRDPIHQRIPRTRLPKKPQVWRALALEFVEVRHLGSSGQGDLVHTEGEALSALHAPRKKKHTLRSVVSTGINVTRVAQIQVLGNDGTHTVPRHDLMQWYFSSPKYVHDAVKALEHMTKTERAGLTKFMKSEFMQSVINTNLRREFTILVSKAGSMCKGSRWTEVQRITGLIVNLLWTRNMTDVTLGLFSDTCVNKGTVQTQRMVGKAFEDELPGGRAYLADALKTIANVMDRTIPNKSVLVMLGSTPVDTERVQDMLQAVALRMGSVQDLAVTFLQIGDDPAANSFFESLGPNDNRSYHVVDRLTSEELEGFSISQIASLTQLPDDLRELEVEVGAQAGSEAHEPVIADEHREQAKEAAAAGLEAQKAFEKNTQEYDGEDEEDDEDDEGEDDEGEDGGEESGAEQPFKFESWLWLKRTKQEKSMVNRKDWIRRYFVLVPGDGIVPSELRWYENQEECLLREKKGGIRQGRLLIDGATVKQITKGIPRRHKITHCFEIDHPKFMERSFGCESEADYNLWLQVIEKAIRFGKSVDQQKLSGEQKRKRRSSIADATAASINSVD